MGDDHSCPVAKVRKNRCERCDRPLADEHQRAMLDACDGPPCSCPAELDLVCYGAAEQACTPIDWRARALAAEADAARLRKLFDAAGQCEHNILALIDHYQSEEHREYRLRIAAEEAARRALVEGLAEAERLRKLVPYRLPTRTRGPSD